MASLSGAKLFFSCSLLKSVKLTVTSSRICSQPFSRTQSAVQSRSSTSGTHVLFRQNKLPEPSFSFFQPPRSFYFTAAPSLNGNVSTEECFALLLLPLRSPGFSRRPAGWQLPHHITWRLKGPHTLLVLCARLILLLGFSGGRDCFQPQVFSLWQLFTLEDFQTNFKHECKSCRVLLDKRNVPPFVPGRNFTALRSVLVIQRPQQSSDKSYFARTTHARLYYPRGKFPLDVQ